MSTAGSNSAANTANAENGNGGGRVRQYAERERIMAPREGIGTHRTGIQSKFISRFTGKPCKLQYGNEAKVQRQPTETAAATLQTHPKVQMHPLLQSQGFSRTNSAKNSLMRSLVDRHNAAVQRAMEEDQAEAEIGNSVEPEKVQTAVGGEEQVQQSAEQLRAKADGPEAEEMASPSAAPQAAQNPEIQTNISPTGEADKNVQSKPQGPFRTRADPNIAHIQRTDSESEAVQMDGDEDIAQKSDTEEAPGNAVSPKNKFVQAAGQQQSGTPELESELKSSKGGGSPMADADRGFFESRMGADFSNVRIHTGSNAVQMNEGLGAKAFAHGSDIYFNANQYQPGTSAGKHLLAHELTHTVQQGGSSVRKSESESAESESVQQGGAALMKSDGSTALTNRAESESVQKSEEEAAAPKIQTKCASCPAEVASIQKTEEEAVQQSEDETAAPKIQTKCDSCAAEEGSVQKTEEEAVQKTEDETAAPKVQTQCASCGTHNSIPQISRTPHSHSALNFQPSLKIGQPGDKYEQEADATADKVMTLSDEQVAPSRAESETVSPQSEEEAAPKLQRSEDEVASPKVQRAEEETASPMIQKEEEMDPELAKQLEEADQAQVAAIDPAPAQAAEAKAQEPNEDLLEGPESAATGELEEAAAEAEAEGGAAKEEAPAEGEMAGEGGAAGPKGKAGGKEEKLGPIGEQLEESSAEVCPSAEAKTQALAQNETTHDSAEDKLGQTESAVEPPAEEGQAMGNASQVEEVDGKPEPTVSEEGAKQELDAAISDSVPNDIDGLNKFKSQGKAAVVGARVMETVNKDVDSVKGTYNEMEGTPAPAAPSNIPQTLPETEQAPETPEMNLGEEAVPVPTEEQTDMTGFDNEAEALKKKEGISQEQLDMVDSGDLAEANKEDKGLKEKVKTAPAQVREDAAQQAAKVDKDAKKEEEKTRTEMRGKRDGALKDTKGKQEKTKTELEKKREAVTQKINGIYEKAKKSVTDKLNNLETVNKVAFDLGQKAASKTFEDEVNADINAWKKKRYSGIFGGVKWLKDKLFGIADFPEVQAAFDRARARYIKRIDQLIKTINDANKKVIAGCKQELANAKVEIKKYVDSLGPELKDAGKAAQADMAKKLEELDGFINKKQKELTEKLCKAKEQAIKDIDKKIEAMKSEMSGLLAKLGNLLLNALKKFFEWALTAVGKDPAALLSILDKGASVISALFKNPIGFLGNLIGAVRKGIDQFQANIKQHLINGLVGWLTGSMSEVAITLPSTWDLKGILHFILQLLGLTWQNLRAKLVKRVGEKPVAMAETGVEIVQRVVTQGPIGLWEWVKEKAGEIKEQVFGGIRNWIITNMVKKGIIKLVSMLNPAGAIVQAIIAIFDTVMFFVENWQSILDMVNAIFDSVANIAAGKVGAAATFIENAMAKTIPLILNFLGRFIGLSGIGKAVQNTVKAIRKPVDNAMDKALDFMEKQVRKLFGGKGKKDADQQKYTQKDKDDAEKGLKTAEKKYIQDGGITKEGANSAGNDAKTKHPVIKSISVVDGGKDWDYDVIFRKKVDGPDKGKDPKFEKAKKEWLNSSHKKYKSTLQSALEDEKIASQLSSNSSKEKVKEVVLEKHGKSKEIFEKPLNLSDQYGIAASGICEKGISDAGKKLKQPVSNPKEWFSPKKNNVYAKSYGALGTSMMTNAQNLMFNKGLENNLQSAARKWAEDVIVNGDSATTPSVDDVFTIGTTAIKAEVDSTSRPKSQKHSTNGVDYDWVAIFPTKGAQLHVKKGTGSPVKATFSDLLSASEIQKMCNKAILDTIKKDTTNGGPTVAANPTIITEVALAANKISSYLAPKELFVITPTAIPRHLKGAAGSPLVRTNSAISPALYTQIAKKHNNSVQVKYKGEIHHILPLYLGGSHHLQNLLSAEGSARISDGAASTVHNELHEKIDNMSLLEAWVKDEVQGNTFESVSFPKLSPDEVRKVVENKLKVVIGTLYGDGHISYEETSLKIKDLK